MPETAAEKKARRKAEKEEKKKVAAAEKLALEQEQAAKVDPPEDDKNDVDVQEVPAPQSDIPLHELNKMAHKSQLARKKAEAKARR